MLFDRAQLEAALPQYEVGNQLGRGAFGLVLEGRHRRLGRPVAIKILTISEPDVERRFLAEAQVMAAFDHPHVVRVHDYAETDGLCLIVMEHLPGGTLAARISPEFPAEQACAIGLAVADALDAAHRRGIVHRDIKPDNVLFAADGAVKVTDFGIAKIFEGSTSTTGTLMGTPAYASPEQITGQRIGPATDVYALGGVLYHLLTARAPFALDLPVPAMLHRHLTQRPELPAGMPPRIAAVVGQALEKDPAGRPASAKKFALSLAAAAVSDLGPGWAARADIPLRIDDDVRNAAAVSKSQVSGRLPAPALVPVSPSGRATTTSGGRHAAPDAEQTTSSGLGGYLRRAAPSTPVPGLPEYGRPPMPESPPSPASGTSSTTYGRSWTDGVGAAPASGGAPVVGSASVSGALPAIGPTSVDSGRRRAPETAPGPGNAPASPAGVSDAYEEREREADPESLASRTPSPRRFRASEDAAQGPWWASRIRLIILIVALVVLAAISVAIGIVAGNAHRSAEYSGAPVSSNGVTVNS